MPDRPHSDNPTPRIYVASLSDYNAGDLHGVWIDAAQEPEALQASIDIMLRASRQPGAEEFAIHDYEGFGPYNLGEYESLAVVSTLALGIEAHGVAFAHYAHLLDTVTTDELRLFDDRYRGHWPSMESYAESYLADMGVDLDLLVPDEWLRPYVVLDTKAFGQQLATEMSASEGEGGIYIFELSD